MFIFIKKDIITPNMYRGTFKDIEENTYTVEITPKGTEGTITEIVLSSNPVTITRKSDNLFSEIKPLGCTIEIMTDKIIPDLYSSNIKDVTVNIYQDETKIFQGYLTPYIYSQPYANVLDTLQLEAVSKLSVLKDIDYTPINYGSNYEIVSFKDILWHILVDGAGYSDDTLRIAYNLNVDKSVKDFKISEANFVDDDDAKTPWTMEEVLTHICRYLGVSCMEFEDDWIHLIDYQQAAATEQFAYSYMGRNVSDIVTSKCQVCGYIVTYYDVPSSCSQCGTIGSMVKVDMGVEENYYTTYSDGTQYITKNDYTSNDSTISYDDIYNKVEVEVNAYQLEELCPDLLDDENNHHMVSYGGNSAIGVYTFQQGDTKTHRLYVTSKVMNANTNWKHYYYRMSDGTDITDTVGYEDYYGSNYNYTQLPHINTRCAVIRQVAKDTLADITPTKLDFEDYIAFYCLDNTTAPHGSYNFSYYVKNGNITNSSGTIISPVEQPVLEYTSDIPVKYCPESGTSWITIKGDLWYQSNWSGSSANILVSDITNSLYAQFPYDGLTPEEAYIPAVSTSMSNNGTFYKIPASSGTTMWMAERDSSNADYGKGWPMMKCKLQIGDYYWDGENEVWTTTESTFYINYNNGPSGGENETFKCLAWQSIASNHTYQDKIGEDCWAIPIKEAVDGQNVTGKLKFTLYTPSQLGPLYSKWNSGCNWQVLFPVIYMKGFELKYVYADDAQWWSPTEDKDDDLVYSNTATNTFKREHEAVEFKINSYSDTVPISRSFVLNSDNTFMTNVESYDTGSTQIMEKHYIEKLLNHYSSKKLIFETSVKYNTIHVNPRRKYRFDYSLIDTFQDGDVKKVFLQDSFEVNLKQNSAKVKYIEW